MEYEVQALGDGVYAIHSPRMTQMVWSVGEMILFCAALNSAGYTPANDWTKLI